MKKKVLQYLIMNRFQVANTNRCQAINSPKGGTLLTHCLTHRRQKTEKIFVLPNICFTEIYSAMNVDLIIFFLLLESPLRGQVYYSFL